MSILIRRQLAGLAIAWVAALLLVAWLVLTGRQVGMDRAERATYNIAAIVEQETARTFQTVYLTLGAIGDAHNLDRRPPKDDPEFQTMMQRRLKDVSFLRAVFIIGPDGWIIHDTDYPRTPKVSLADRPYFRAHRDDPGFAGTVWPPVVSRSGTGWFLPVTRPLGRSGAFEGIVVAAIQAELFAAQFRNIRLGKGDAVALLHEGGALVAVYPPVQDAVGKSFGELPMFAAARAAPGGSFWTDRSFLPGERMVTYRRVQNAPFIVCVSRSKEAALAEWGRTAAGAAIAMAVLTFFLGWYVVRLARESARRQRDRDRRAQAEKMEALGQLTGGIAHDFSNMLNIIAMNVALLKQRPVDPSIAGQAIATMERAVEGGIRVIGRLLSFARKRPLAMAQVQLDDWLQAAQPLLAQAAGPRVTVSIESEPKLPKVLCDAAELDMALVNLVVNARDAMAGAGRVTVKAFACDSESRAPKAFTGTPAPYVCIGVQDTGPGMPEEVKRRALEPFYSTKGETGSGLGLSQVYGFMQRLGGSMTIESEPGRGTTIHLFFPVAPAGSASKP